MAEDQIHAQRFADALQRFEQDGHVDRFVSESFTEDAELLRPELTQQGSGHDGVRDFWRQYRDQFISIRSDFARVSQHGDLGVLEWRTSATRTSGRDITYAGVSLLDFTPDGRVQRFATYFDTGAFLGGHRFSAPPDRLPHATGQGNSRKVRSSRQPPSRQRSEQKQKAPAKLTTGRKPS